MLQASATQIKNRFGEYLQQAQREPVAIEKNGRVSAVIISIEQYQHLLTREDDYWGKLAQAAEKDPSIGSQETMDFLHTRLNQITDA